MCSRWFAVLILVLLAMAPDRAFGWWEATLQQVEIDLLINQEGRTRVKYDLRYHVDRGRFEGVNLSNPGREVQWDRMVSFIEDARGRRYPLRISRRGKDGAFIVRIARGPGLRRGWVTVHVEYEADVLDCCLRIDDEDRVHLDWSALTWNVGLDRMTVTVHTAPPGYRLVPDEATEHEFTIEQIDNSLVVERIRPVRWYEMRIGLWLPPDFLRRRPPRMQREDPRPLPGEEDVQITAPLEQQENHADATERANLYFVILSFTCLLILIFKTWLTARGYLGHVGVAPPLILPKVPSLMRWAFVGALLLVGGWLQSSQYLAAGTLAFVSGILLSLRGPVRRNDLPAPQCWQHTEIQSLRRFMSQESSARRRWAALADGTTFLGFPIACGIVVGGIVLVQLFDTELVGHTTDTVILDFILTGTAFFMTGRRRDTVPSRAEGVSHKLWHCARKLTPSLEKWGTGKRALLGSIDSGGQTTEVKLALTPAPPGTATVTIASEPKLGIFGWSLFLVANVETPDGASIRLISRRPGVLARRLRRCVDKVQRTPRKD